MQSGQKKKSWKRYLNCGKPSVSVYAGAIIILLMGATANAASKAEGLSFQANGLKISLQLASPNGTKVTFKRADYSRR